MINFRPQHMRPWQETVNYSGENFDKFFVVTWHFFRCSPAERANFKYIRRHARLHEFPRGSLIFPKFTDAIRLFRVYALAHQDFPKVLRICDMWAKKIAGRRCLDHNGERREDESTVERTWRQSELRQRMEMCSDAGLSIFAARRTVIPPEVCAVLSEVQS